MRQIIASKKFTVRDEKPHEFWDKPPIECEFKLGDKVTYTNPYGVSFPGHTIVGFTETANNDWDYRYIYLDLDCWWMPQNPGSLKLE